MADTFNSGFYSTATVNGIELPMNRWGVNASATMIEVNNSLSGVVPIPYPTFQHYTVSLTIDRSYTHNPFGSPINFNLTSGNLTNVRLYENQSAKSMLDGPVWVFSTVTIVDINQTVEIAGKNMISITGRGWQTVTLPVT